MKRGRSHIAKAAAAEAHQAEAGRAGAALERRRIGAQLDLLGGQPLELFRPRPSVPSTWSTDIRRYHRATTFADLENSL